MQSKSSVAMAAVVVLAAASANAVVETNMGVKVPVGGLLTPSISSVKTTDLSSIPQLKIVNVAGFNAASAIGQQIPGAAKQSPVAAVQNDQRIQVMVSQDAKADKAGASIAYFDNGASSMKPVTAVEGKMGVGLAPLAAASVRTPSSKSLSSIAYGSYNAANGGMVWDAFKRIGRAIGSIFSIFSKKVNTPELSAEAYMADLKTRGEKMQGLVAGAAKQKSLLEIQVKNEALRIAELTAKRDAALKANRDDVAAMYDGQLAPLETSHVSNREQLDHARQNLESAKQTLADFVQKRESEYARVSAKLGELNAKKARAQLDGLKDSMRVGGNQSKDEFDRAVNDQIAEAEGKSEASKATGQDQMEDFERDMEKAAQKERLEKRKKELGLGGSTEQPK